MSSIISVKNLDKTYASGFQALKNVNLEIRPGEIFALLGPNGAGKTTLINIICGIVTPSGGQVIADNIPRFEMSLAHARFLPDESVNPTSLLPSWPGSGLVATYAQNLLNATSDPQTLVHPGANGIPGYVIQPINATVTQLTKIGDQRISVGGGLKYYAERPPGGPDWGVRLVLTLLFPQ